MHLLVNGCSHTAGAELDYPTQGMCYEKAYGAQLAKRLDSSYENLAMSGASNHRIVRTTYEWLYKYVSDGKSIKDLFIVVMWPGSYRTEIHFDKNLGWNFDDKWLPLVVGNDEQYRELFPRTLYNYYRAWTVFTDTTTGVIEYYNSVLNLQNLLMRYKINYLFINAVDIPGALNYEFNLYQIHINKNNFHHFGDPDKVYTFHCGQSGKSISPHSVASGFNSHYDEETHSWYGNYLFDYIKENELL